MCFYGACTKFVMKENLFLFPFNLDIILSFSPLHMNAETQLTAVLKQQLLVHAKQALIL